MNEPASSDELPSGFILGNYEILATIGEGASLAYTARETFNPALALH